jgi:hypothetical protein
MATTATVPSKSFVSMSPKTSMASAENPAGPVTAASSVPEPSTTLRIAWTSRTIRSPLSPTFRGTTTSADLPSWDGCGGEGGSRPSSPREAISFVSFSIVALSAGVIPEGSR